MSKNTNKQPHTPPPAQYTASNYDYEDEFEDEYEYEDEPEYDEDFEYRDIEPPRNSNVRAARTRSTRDYRRVAAPQRNYAPYVMGGLIGALLVGLMGLAYALGMASRSSRPANSNANTQPPQQSGGTTVEPIRVTLAEFKTLYDSQQRPMIVDVRAKDRYDLGHIAGAVNIPDAQTESRLAELPKDRLIVAYCQ